MEKESSMKSVAVVGTQARIGTTTQALQIILNLKALDYHVAYVEMGFLGFLDKIKERGEDLPIEKDGTIICDGIPMYSSQNIHIANRKGYDFLVKDYGNVKNPYYQEMSFLEQDVKIVVGGIKVDEVEHTENVLANELYSGVYYILNFVDQSQQQDAKADMRDFKGKTYFSIYTPDPFIFIANEIYSYILGDCGEI